MYTVNNIATPNTLFSISNWDTTARKMDVDRAAQSVNKNNANQPTSSPALAVHDGMKSIATATIEIADYVRTHPSEASDLLERAKAVAKQYTELIDRSSQFVDERNRLQATAEEAVRASEWIGNRYPNNCGNQCIPVANYGNVVGEFNDLLAK